MVDNQHTEFALGDILSLDRTLFSAREDSKKRLFELISQIATKASVHLDQHEILTGLLAREKLGSTAIGHGVAIPHTRVRNIQEPIGILIHLQQPINFDALDKQPVDLFFGILVPEENHQQHLLLLAELARLFQEECNRRLLRQAGDDEKLFQQIISISRAISV